jgi:cellulose synthase operon protein C
MWQRSLLVSTTSAFREWIARYPAEPSPRQEYIGFLIDQRTFALAELQIAAYTKAFPADEVYPVEAAASLASHRESDEAAIRVYDRAFQPLWPKALTEAWFKLLDDNQELRDFEGRARTALRNDPGDLNTAARLVAYYQHAGNIPAAKRILLEYRIAKESTPGSWTAAELKTVAALFEALQDVNEQARAYYALYSFPGVRAEDKEAALAGLASLLLERPDEPIRFGSGDLSFYKDVATADSSPGFLNGILSLVLNSTTPRWQYQQQNDKSVAYFHRAAGAQLLQALEREFPNRLRRGIGHAGGSKTRPSARPQPFIQRLCSAPGCD